MQCYIAKCNLPKKKQTIFCKMQSLKKKQKGGKNAEKFLMKDVQPLIDSILESDKQLTEELICTALGYNTGYIAQCRSREKTTKKPQVTQKFLNQLNTLQFAKKPNQTDSQPKNSLDPLSEALSVIKEQNEWLRKLVDSSLAGLSRDVNNNAVAIQAEIRGYGKYQILKQSNWDDQEFAKAMAVVDRIYGEELKVDDQQGKGMTGI
jgi:hypothetical protein